MNAAADPQTRTEYRVVRYGYEIGHYRDAVKATQMVARSRATIGPGVDARIQSRTAITTYGPWEDVR